MLLSLKLYSFEFTNLELPLNQLTVVHP